MPGMKEGTGSDPFSSGDEGDARATETDTSTDNSASSESMPDEESSPETTKTQSESTTPDAQRQQLPYIHARSSVKEGRDQKPMFLRPEVQEGIDGGPESLINQVEREIGEDVYKTDIIEAGLVVAQEHPDLVLEVLKRWGYGMK